MRKISGVVVLSTALTALGWAEASAQLLQVSRSTWDGLDSADQATIQNRHVVEIFEHGSFGLVIDAQGADRSDPGTTAGALLGSVGAQAAYLDRAFSGGNYSALTQLGFALLGGVLGSVLDRPSSQNYQFRYALRLSNGEVQYIDAMNKEPFRHPPGVCLSIPALRPISQTVCSNGSDDLRRQYLPSRTSSSHVTSAFVTQPTELTPPVRAPTEAAVASPTQVHCQLGNLPPVLTTAEKCAAIGGSRN
jgi:hypothetical protein